MIEWTQGIPEGLWVPLVGGAGVAAFALAAGLRRWWTAPWRGVPIDLGDPRAPPRWGRVYALRDTAVPRLVKVGFTCRRMTARRDEVSETMAGGAFLVQVFAIDGFFPQAVEARAHIRLRRHRARVAGRGREWFMAGRRGGCTHIARAMVQAARDVRRAAKRAGRWEPWMDDRVRTVRREGGMIVKELLFR